MADQKKNSSIVQPIEWPQLLVLVLMISGMISAVVTWYGTEYYRSKFWPPLQQAYWPQYRTTLPFLSLWELNENAPHKYQIVAMTRPIPSQNNSPKSKKSTSKTETEEPQVERVWPSLEFVVRGETGALALTPEKADQGWKIEIITRDFSRQEALEKMKVHVFEGVHVYEIFWRPLYIGVSIWGILTVGIMSFLMWGRKSPGQSIVLRGTELIKADEMNPRISGGTGGQIGIPYLPKIPLWKRLIGRTQQRHQWIWIRTRDLTEHMLIAGDTRQGKSTLMKWLMLQLRKLGSYGYRSVVYDPDLEFWEQLAKPDDIWLYPPDKRCPYWDLEAEIETEDDAEALARAFLPPENEVNPTFWDMAKTRLFKFLLIRMKMERCGVAGLLDWLRDENKIDALIQAYDETLKPLIKENAAPQRAGVFGALSAVADSLKKLPPNDGRPRFSFRHWAKTGKNWVFIGSNFGSQDVLRPVIAAMIQTMCGALMRDKNAPRTFFFLDEIPSLGKLVSLKNALQRAGKFNLIFILGFQGRAQLEHIYGREAETLMSAPGIRIFLKTKEYGAAEWCANNAGKPEQERQVESVTSGEGENRGSRTYNLERKIQHLITPNEFQNLEKLHGYLRYDKYLCEIRFGYPNLPQINSVEVRPEKILSPQHPIQKAMPVGQTTDQKPKPSTPPLKKEASEDLDFRV
jgi:hypothetical protein